MGEFYIFWFTDHLKLDLSLVRHLQWEFNVFPTFLIFGHLRMTVLSVLQFLKKVQV